MSLRGKGSTLGAWKFSKLLGSKFTPVFLVLQPRSDTLVVSPASRFFFFFLVKGGERKKRLETLARFLWAVGMQLPEFPPPFCDVC